MNISSVGSTYTLLQNVAAQRLPEAAEVRRVGRDNDGDGDDKGVKAVAVTAPPSPTVNLSGQEVGQVVNVVA